MQDRCASDGWADIPGDILGRVLQLVELPEALAVGSVCRSWCSVAVASGVPAPHTPWLVSVATTDQDRGGGTKFQNLLDICKSYSVRLPSGRRYLAWCGSSHGWLIASDELSNLVLCNPFSFATIYLPPITDFESVKGVYNSEGSIVGYLLGEGDNYSADADPRLEFVGNWFYQKVVLSCDPSLSGGDDYIAMAIHYDANCVSFARANEGCWRFGTSLSRKSRDRYADCAYDNGRFYTVTMRGVLEMWDLHSTDEPIRELIIPNGDKRYKRVLTRFLVPTPWGDLLQIRTLRLLDPSTSDAEVLKVDVENHELVQLTPAAAFRGCAVFVGLNHSACLSTKEFPKLRPIHVYFTTPWLTHRDNFGFGKWTGVVTYDLENQMTEDVICTRQCVYSPEKIWFIPNLRKQACKFWSKYV